MVSLCPCAQRNPQALGLVPVLALMTLLSALLPTSSAHAVSKDSPEVLDLVEKGLAYLEEKSTESRLGGKCLIGLAFYKAKRPKDHPKIVAAINACKKAASEDARVEESIYSNALAIIFLCEIDAQKHSNLIEKFAGAMASRQKNFGAWSYDNYNTGDTSQTQYAVLSFWEMVQVGFSPSVQKIDNCANWLMRTQDPSGGWAYQGNDPGNFTLTAQNKTTSSMLLAGMGGMMMSGHIVGILTTANQQQAELEELPPALRRVEDKSKKKIRSLTGSSLDRTRFRETLMRGKEWFDKNFVYAEGNYPYYELYSLERYKSFEELLTGDAPDEPDWYNKGYQYLKNKIKDNGSWKGLSGDDCSTAFAVLFLLRSTQESIKASLGAGTLIGNRGLSANLNEMKLKNGRLVAQPKPTEVDKLLGMLEGDESADLDALLKSPASLQMDNVSPKEARRLQQIVKSGSPESRILAVRALGRMRDLDLVPILLYAMTDPDKRVVREARDALRLVSRRFQGYGLKDNFEDAERYDVIEQWKQWYRRVRPNAPPLP